MVCRTTAVRPEAIAWGCPGLLGSGSRSSPEGAAGKGGQQAIKGIALGLELRDEELEGVTGGTAPLVAGVVAEFALVCITVAYWVSSD